MKNHRELLGVIANVLIVVLVLLIIIIGLNKIGVYSLPSWAEKIIGTYEGNDFGGTEDDRIIYNSLNKTTDSTEDYQTADLTYENAHKILSKLSPAKNYSQQYVIESISGTNCRTERVSVNANDGLYSASIYDSNGVLLKSIYEGKEKVSVLNYHYDDIFVNEFEKGFFNVYEECGFVLNVENFFSSNFPLDGASFKTTVDESFGSVMTIAFISNLNDISITEQYTISLDYGVVVSAFCFENDELIYSMITENISMGS